MGLKLFCLHSNLQVMLRERAFKKGEVQSMSNVKIFLFSLTENFTVTTTLPQKMVKVKVTVING